MSDGKRELFGKLVAQDKLRHAYLFFGGISAAYAFAREFSVFLECGVWVSKQPLIDVLIIEPVDGTIGIDAVREARNFAYRKPLVSKRRTIVVNDAGLLTAEAAASALKLTEDAPAATLIIFIASQKDALSPALASRLMPVYFPSPAKVDGDGRPPAGGTLLEDVEAAIVGKYREDKRRNTPLIRELLRKQTELARYNLNEKLQRKAVEQSMRNS